MLSSRYGIPAIHGREDVNGGIGSSLAGTIAPATSTLGCSSLIAKFAATLLVASMSSPFK